jgi:hypothetical protein
MEHYLAQNAKLKKASFKTYNFGIPALRSQEGFNTCPSAGKCAKPNFTPIYSFGGKEDKLINMEEDLTRKTETSGIC